MAGAARIAGAWTLGRRLALRPARLSAGGRVIGLGAVAAGELAPAASAATAFGYTNSGGYFTVSTGAGEEMARRIRLTLLT